MSAPKPKPHLFEIDPQIGRDSRLICDLTLSQLRLLNDKRFPWLVLVPRVPNVTELFELDEGQSRQLLSEISHVSHTVKKLFAAEKMNVAAIGNKVRQLHVHIVARHATDISWPGVVWDKGPAEHYDQALYEQRCNSVETALQQSTT